MNPINTTQLRARILKIAEMEGINKRLLHFDGLPEFFREHKSHGGYKLSLVYDKKGLLYMDVECAALGLVHTDECRHNDSETSLEDSFMPIYQRK